MGVVVINLAIEGTTRRIGKSQGYLGLCVKDFYYEDGTPAMMTAWELTPAERERIAAGENLYLTLLGSAHPPVLLQVGGE